MRAANVTKAGAEKSLGITLYRASSVVVAVEARPSGKMVEYAMEAGSRGSAL
jgi:hypothetical protein